MHIRLICIGKPSQEYSVLIREYEKRLPKYCRFEVFEVKKEEEIIGKIKGFLVILDKSGREKSSESFAEFLKLHENETVAFVIGSDAGLSEDFKKKASLLFSFSEMTFPHQLARVMLTEQIYRALTILKGEKYHK